MDSIFTLPPDPTGTEKKGRWIGVLFFIQSRSILSPYKDTFDTPVSGVEYRKFEVVYLVNLTHLETGVIDFLSGRHKRFAFYSSSRF